MATKKKTTEVAVSGAFMPDYSALLKTVERQFKLTQSSTDVEARKGSYLSTGLLATDLILGGGFLSGTWCTVFGAEQTSKSTLCMHAIISAVEQDVPLIVYFSYEGSEDFGYFASTIETCATRKLSVEDVFGIVDRSTGEIIKQPRVRVYNESVGEQFFDSMASMLRNMPDKNYIDGQWYYVYENTKPNQKLTAGLYNKELFSEYNKFCVPAENGKPQALLLVDSYPYMFPDQLDEDDKGAGMAAVARMFSANIPKLAPKLKRKGVVVLGVNQLRLRPAVRNANPEYEPSGEAIKFCSGVRVKQTRRAIPHGTGSVEEEDSVMIDGGLDTYHYLVQKAAKNKTGGITGAEVWQRVWVADAEGKAHGIDPVWDAFQYLKLTGQLTGHMKKMTIKLPHLELTKISWWDFKCLILYQGADLKAVCTELGIKKNPKIRETCRNQLNNGTGYQMYIEHTRQTGSAEEAEEEGE